MDSIQPIMPWAVGPDYPRWTETLRDKTRVVIRPITPHDAAAEKAFIEGLSPESRRFRFLGHISHASDELVKRLTTLDYVKDVAFAAVLPEDSHQKFLGVSRYSVSPDAISCECAVAVLDEWHHKGLGTLLMRHLIEVARARGIVHLYSIDSVENSEMTALARFLGFNRRMDKDDPSQVIHSLWLLPPTMLP